MIFASDSDPFASIKMVFSIIGVIGFLIVGVIGKRAGWFHLVSGTNKLLREQNADLWKRNELLETEKKETAQKHEADRKDWYNKFTLAKEQIDKMRGQIETLSALQLNKIADALHEISESNKVSAKANENILNILEKSAKTLVTDTKQAHQDAVGGA